MMPITSGGAHTAYDSVSAVRLLSARCPLSVSVAGGLLDIVEAAFAQQLLEYSPDALLLVGPDGAISFLNTAAERLFGYPRAQLLGADHSLLLAEASREEFHGVLAGLTKAASPGSPTAGSPSPGSSFASPPFAGSGRRADGTELPVEITCSLVPAPAGAGDAGTSVALSIRGAAGGNQGAVVRLVQRELLFLEVPLLPPLRRLPSTTTSSRPARSVTL
jgi:hypothetical protein